MENCGVENWLRSNNSEDTTGVFFVFVFWGWGA